MISVIFVLLIAVIPGCRTKRDTEIERKEIFNGVEDTTGKQLRIGVRGGSMVRADIEELDTLNIVTTRARSAYAVLNLVFEGLLSINPFTGIIEGGIAKGYSIVNDGHSILLQLNQNVRFSDGTPCTADDVLFTFEEIYLNPNTHSRKTEMLRIRESIISIKKIDDFTIRIDLSVPYRPFLYTLTGLHILPGHIISHLIEKDGIKAFNSQWGTPDGDISRLIGTGPYLIKEVKWGEYIKLERNPYYGKREGRLYVQGMPYLDEIVELIGLDNETKLLKFKTGEIDFYEIKDYDISNGDLELLIKNRKEGNYKIFTGGQTLRGNHFLAFNLNKNVVDRDKLVVFQDPRFRKAVSHLIDRQYIRDEVYKGYAYIEGSTERNVSPFYKKIDPEPFDMAESKRLLSEMGLADKDGDGFLDLPSGKPFSFTILTNDDSPLRVDMANIITSSLRSAGINALSSPISYDAIVTKLMDLFTWEAVLLGIEGSIDPNDSSRVWESKGAIHLWHPYQETPETEWEQRIDELFALGRTTWDFERAREYYHAYQEIIARELPIIPIITPAELYGFRNKYGNLIPRAVSYNSIDLIPYIYQKRLKAKR
ncbi:MAG: ABC transporter substrate-binding protein [Spirochaetota bacterium]